jgi:type I restriction enzyme S subunit
MREMKDSGIEWIGEIPLSWNVQKGKYLFMQRNERGNRIELQLLSPTQNYGVIPQTIYEELSGMSAVKLNEKANLALFKTIHKGDYCISLRSFQGGFEYSEYEGVVSPAYQVFYAVVNIANGYYKYLFKDTGFIEKINSYTMTLRDGKNIAFKDFGDTYIPYPPVVEQKRISIYLEKKCAEIDALTADIQSQIDALEQYKRSVITEAVTKGLNPDADMKDSGVRWIGQMPAHWECIRGKYILRYLQKPIREDDGVITCFRDGEVTLRSNRREDGFTMSDKEIGYQGIDVGDLVVHGMDGFAGSIGISDSRGKASPVLNVLDTKQNKRYVMYYLRSMAYSDVFVAMATGIRVRSCDLRWNKLSELQYPVPPIGEQEKIVNHIDAVLQRTNDVIADKQAQLATLDEYKKSLIFEYVTGKKEVPVS